MPEPAQSAVRQLGEYELGESFDAGGMATLRLGRKLGPLGFARVVAIKCLHPHLTSDPRCIAMFMDEARIAARLRHANIVTTFDVVANERDLFIVLEYVHGESLSKLTVLTKERKERIPLDVASAIVSGALRGLHAAHEATGPDGGALDVVHRDVSPQNIMVGVDGNPRLLDFGIAKAADRLQITTEIGGVKGKLAYLAPEQIRDKAADRRTDIYSAGVVLWEVLAGRRLFFASNDGAIIDGVLVGAMFPPSKFAPDVPEALDSLTMKALSLEPQDRFATAKEMAEALEACVPPAHPSRVGAWVETMAAEALERRAKLVADIEKRPRGERRESFDASRPAPTDVLAHASSRAVDTAQAEAPPSAARQVQRRSSARSRKARASALIGLALFVLAIVAFGRRWTDHAVRSDATNDPSAAAAVAVGAPAAMPTETAASGPDPNPTSVGALEGSSVVTREPPAPSAARAPLRPHGSGRRGSKPAAGPAMTQGAVHTDPCTPPYVLDSSGYRVYKRGCL